jgi:hypothetical protein
MPKTIEKQKVWHEGKEVAHVVLVELVPWVHKRLPNSTVMESDLIIQKTIVNSSNVHEELTMKKVWVISVILMWWSD